MSLMTRATAALVRRQQQAAVSGNAVTYARGAERVDLTNKAWCGRTLFRRNPLDVSGAAVVWGDRDYLIPVADLVIGGIAVTPKRGDRVEETIGGVVVTFEVVTPPNEPEWRYSDQGRAVYRVHTKKVA